MKRDARTNDAGAVPVCPNCDFAGIASKQAGWRCRRCKTDFAEPARREPYQASGNASAHGRALIDADPDDLEDGRIVTDGGRTDMEVLAALEKGDDVQFAAETDDGRVLARLEHGRVDRVLNERNDEVRLDVVPVRDEDLDLARNIHNRERLRLRGSTMTESVSVYSLDRDGGRSYVLGRTRGTLTTRDIGGESKVLSADGGEPEGAIDNSFDDAERDAREQLAERNAEHRRRIDVGDIVIDLVTRQPLSVVGVAAPTVVEYFEEEDFDLLTYNQAPYLPVEMSDMVFECVFIPGLDGLHKLDQTYDYPSGRLARVPIESAMEASE